MLFIEANSSYMMLVLDYLTGSNVNHVTFFSMYVNICKMLTTLAVPCTPCDPLYIRVFDDCKDDSDDTASHLSDWYILSCKRANRLVLGSSH